MCDYVCLISTVAVVHTDHPLWVYRILFVEQLITCEMEIAFEFIRHGSLRIANGLCNGTVCLSVCLSVHLVYCGWAAAYPSNSSSRLNSYQIIFSALSCPLIGIHKAKAAV